MDEKRAKFLPVLGVSGNSIPEAWENAFLAVADKGIVYKRGDEADSEDQIDCCMTIEIRNPDADPFSHKLGGTNAIANPLLDYYYEMMGAKNCWIKDFNDPADTRWDYLYHERLANNPAGNINQVEFAIKRLIERPFSRRTNIITWYPPRDTISKDTPCLQRLWFNIIPATEEKNAGLDMHYNFRSRNVVNASFGNIHGVYMLGCHIRDKVEETTGKPLGMRMIDNIDSFHVNSKDYSIFFKNVEIIKSRASLEDRTWNRERVVNILRDCRDEVEEAIFKQTEKVYKGDLEKEKERVCAIGSRIFYLLDKYAPKVA